MISKVNVRWPSPLEVMAVITIIVLGIINMGQHSDIEDLKETNRLCKETKDNLQAGYLSYKDKYTELMDKAWHSENDLIAYIDAKYTNVPVEVATSIAKSINLAVDEYRVDFSLVVGIMEIESRFDPMARSPKGAVGLMQIMPNIWGESLCVADEKDFYDIETNITCGVKVFVHYLEKSDGDISEALWRYNGTGGKKGEFADLVYKAVGKFETFRAVINGEYGSEEAAEVPAD